MPTDQGSLETCYLSQEPPGPCLENETLGYSLSDPEDHELYESAQGTLDTLPCMENTAEIPPVTQEIIEPLSTAEDYLRFLPPSTFSPEAEEPLPSTQFISKISESVSVTLESLLYLLGGLGHLKTNEGDSGPLSI